MSRAADLAHFYGLLAQLEHRVGGTRTLASLRAARDWPQRGVYFFFELGEARNDSGEGPRVVRVGTHALTAGAKSTLAQRLGQHRGLASGGGNHRGSIFRLLVGQALQARGLVAPCPSWGVRSDAAAAASVLSLSMESLLAAERPVEAAVTRYLGAMPFLWLEIADDAGQESQRGMIERNAIALLSNYARPALDPPSREWLGLASDRKRISASGLWNQRHVDEPHDPHFLDVLKGHIEIGGGSR